MGRVGVVKMSVPRENSVANDLMWVDQDLVYYLREAGKKLNKIVKSQTVPSYVKEDVMKQYKNQLKEEEKITKRLRKIKIEYEYLAREAKRLDQEMQKYCEEKQEKQ